jgi:hypothetical protein
MELCPTLFWKGRTIFLCLQLPYLMLSLRPYFLGMGIRFCSLKADFSFLKYVFQNQRFVGFQGIGWFQFIAKQIRIKEPSVPVLGNNQNQRTTSFGSLGKR